MKILLCLNLICLVPLASGQAVILPDLAGVTRTFLNEGESRVTDVVAAIAADGDFHRNLEVVLTTIVESDLPNAVKVDRLKTLETHVREYGRQQEEMNHSKASTVMWAGAFIGALVYGAFGPGAAGHDQIDFLIVPAMNALQNGVAGLTIGALIGAAIGVPWQLLSRPPMVDASSIGQIDTKCRTILSRESIVPEASLDRH